MVAHRLHELALAQGVPYAISLTRLASMANFLRVACLSIKTRN